MSDFIAPMESLSEVWSAALNRVHDGGGRTVHLGMTVTQPGIEIAGIRSVLDGFLAEGWPKKVNTQSVDTVASTIFPLDLYRPASYSWAPDLNIGAQAQLDSAKSRLFDGYLSMLPTLTSVRANNRGTYFSRMISWPGNEVGGPNQLERCVQALRVRRNAGTFSNNLQDLDLAADSQAEAQSGGLQLTKADESRIFGFPCLVHISLTIYKGKLNLMAVYRHQYLVTKAYGNLLGLSYLQHFIAQQSGFEVGELAVQATFADVQYSDFTKVNIKRLVAEVAEARSCA